MLLDNIKTHCLYKTLRWLDAQYKNGMDDLEQAKAMDVDHLQMRGMISFWPAIIMRCAMMRVGL